MKEALKVKINNDQIVTDVPEGEYLPRFVDWEWQMRDTGKIVLKFEITEGEYEGRILPKWFNAKKEDGEYIVKPKSNLSRFLSMGRKNCNEVDTDILIGFTWRIRVEMKENRETGEMYSSIKEITGPVDQPD